MAVTDSNIRQAYSPRINSSKMTKRTPAILPKLKNVPVTDLSCLGVIYFKYIGAIET